MILVYSWELLNIASSPRFSCDARQRASELGWAQSRPSKDESFEKYQEIQVGGPICRFASQRANQKVHSVLGRAAFPRRWQHLFFLWHLKELEQSSAFLTLRLRQTRSCSRLQRRPFSKQLHVPIMTFLCPNPKRISGRCWAPNVQ